VSRDEGRPAAWTMGSVTQSVLATWAQGAPGYLKGRMQAE
jgi:hypothetical protein